MGIQDTKRRQEEQLAAKAKQQPVAQPESAAQPHPVTQPEPQIDLQLLRQMIQEVVRAELQTTRTEPIDMKALQQAIQAVFRAELQSVEAAVTILARSVQAQTEALMSTEAEAEEQQQDEPLPTSALMRRTDDDEDREDEQVYPPDDEEELDEEGEVTQDEEEEHITSSLPRPEPPTHKLKSPGPIALLLGDGIVSRHPAEGARRWEPMYEQ